MQKFIVSFFQDRKPAKKGFVLAHKDQKSIEVEAENPEKAVWSARKVAGVSNRLDSRENGVGSSDHVFAVQETLEAPWKLALVSAVPDFE